VKYSSAVCVRLRVHSNFMRRIHIVGSGPRTGTTLLAELMAACFHIDHTCEHEAPICTDQPKEGNCFLTKQPGDMAYVGLPLALNPELYVICIIRDPRDSVVSFHRKSPGLYWTGLKFWKLFGRKYDKLAKHSHFILIKYEDLVRNPDEIQNHLMRKMPFLERKHKFTEYHRVAKPSEESLKALKDVRSIESTSIGNWKKHLPRIKQQISIHGSISEELVRFGYEPDKCWERVLDGVEEINYKTARPEFFSTLNLLRHKNRELKEAIKILIRRLGLNPVIFFYPFTKFYAMGRTILRPILRSKPQSVRRE